jgi:hypothetical protein
MMKKGGVSKFHIVSPWQDPFGKLEASKIFFYSRHHGLSIEIRIVFLHEGLLTQAFGYRSAARPSIKTTQIRETLRQSPLVHTDGPPRNGAGFPAVAV